MKTLEGNVIGKGLKVGIVAARFNEFIVNKLIGGAEDALVRHGVDTNDVELAYVPGAFEIPIVAQKMAASGKYDAVICLGAVIKGSTSHYDYVCAEVSKGVATVGLNTGVPTLFGVLTTDNIEQAIERAGTKAGNKGFECAEGAGTKAGNKGYDVACSAIEMVNLMKELDKINRVIGNLIEGAPQETLLVIDATTGQNGISQAKQFKEITNITGIVLTKLDGTAKGGIVLAIKEEVNIPVKFIGLGEGMEDLKTFDIEKYIYGLFKELL